MNNLQKTVQNCFVGGAVGDAAGLPTEGIGRHQIFAQYRNLMAEDASLEAPRFVDFNPTAIFLAINAQPRKIIDAVIKREGVSSTFQSQYSVYTDDTSQLLTIVESIIEYQGEIDRLDVARRLHRWAFDDGIGMGRNFFNAVSHEDFFDNPHAAAFDYLESLNFVPAANGAVMRSAQLGLLARTKPEDFHFLVADIAAITHANPRCILSSVFVASLVAGIQQQADEDLIAFALEKSSNVYSRAYDADAPWTIGIANYRSRCAPRHWHDAYAELLQLVENICSSSSLRSLAQIQPDCDMDNVVNAPIGYTYLPVRLVTAAIKLQLPFDVAVLQTISLGGDSDTNASVVGAVLATINQDNPYLRSWLKKLLPVQEERILDTARRFEIVLATN